MQNKGQQQYPTQETIKDQENAPGWTRFFNSPLTLSMEAEIRKATNTVYNIQSSLGTNVYRELVEKCDGIAFLTVMRGGLFWTGTFGTGIVVVKDKTTMSRRLRPEEEEGGGGDGDVWSAPCAVMGLGTGIGLQGGLDVTDLVLFFRTEDAVECFQGNHQVVLGVSGGIALGFVGREAAWEYHLGGGGKTALAYTLSWCKGLYVGGSLELKWLKVLHWVNKAFYGKEMDARTILTSRELRSASTLPLQRALNDLCRLGTSAQ